MTNDQPENISLSLPVNAAYVSAARLTASSIANRMGFNIDEVEDVKAAVSEACIYVIKKMPSDVRNDFSIVFHLDGDFLKINLKTQSFISIDSIDEDMGLLMIKTLMDEFDINNTKDDTLTINMVKRHCKVSF